MGACHSDEPVLNETAGLAPESKLRASVQGDVRSPVANSGSDAKGGSLEGGSTRGEVIISPSTCKSKRISTSSIGPIVDDVNMSEVIEHVMNLMCRFVGLRQPGEAAVLHICAEMRLSRKSWAKTPPRSTRGQAEGSGSDASTIRSLTDAKEYAARGGSKTDEKSARHSRSPSGMDDSMLGSLLTGSAEYDCKPLRLLQRKLIGALSPAKISEVVTEFVEMIRGLAIGNADATDPRIKYPADSPSAQTSPTQTRKRSELDIRRHTETMQLRALEIALLFKETTRHRVIKCLGDEVKNQELLDAKVFTYIYRIEEAINHLKRQMHHNAQRKLELKRAIRPGLQARLDAAAKTQAAEGKGAKSAEVRALEALRRAMDEKENAKMAQRRPSRAPRNPKEIIMSVAFCFAMKQMRQMRYRNDDNWLPTTADIPGSNPKVDTSSDQKSIDKKQKSVPFNDGFTPIKTPAKPALPQFVSRPVRQHGGRGTTPVSSGRATPSEPKPKRSRSKSDTAPTPPRMPTRVQTIPSSLTLVAAARASTPTGDSTPPRGNPSFDYSSRLSHREGAASVGGKDPLASAPLLRGSKGTTAPGAGKTNVEKSTDQDELDFPDLGRSSLVHGLVDAKSPTRSPNRVHRRRRSSNGEGFSRAQSIFEDRRAKLGALLKQNGQSASGPPPTRSGRLRRSSLDLFIEDAFHEVRKTVLFRSGGMVDSGRGTVFNTPRFPSLLNATLDKIIVTTYAPRIFDEIRQTAGEKRTDFYDALSQALEPFYSNSKSNAAFYFSKCGRYMIKTVKEEELQCLIQQLKNYHKYCLGNTTTLLARTFAAFKVQLDSRIYHILVLESVWDPRHFIHVIYDLKGSAVGRHATKEDMKKLPTNRQTSIVLKDNDCREAKRRIVVGATRAKRIKQQIQRDVEFLGKLGVLDYSLLVGVHIPSQPRPLRRQSIHTTPYPNGVSTSTPSSSRATPSHTPVQTPSTSRRSSMSHLDGPSRRGPAPVIPQSVPEDSTAVASTPPPSKFGLSAPTSSGNSATSLIETELFWGKDAFRSRDGTEVYFFGIIDYLVEFSLLKQGEYFIKSKIQGLGQKMSVMPPKEYAQRFEAFVSDLFQ